jgi:hypothetical protein
MQILL